MTNDIATVCLQRQCRRSDNLFNVLMKSNFVVTECPANCVSCDNLGSGQCGTCADGYGLGSDFTCKS